MSTAVDNSMPDAIREAQERLARARGEANAPDGATPPEGKPTDLPPQPPAPAKPATDEDREALVQKIAELKQDIARKSGEYGSTLKRLQDQLAQMDAQMKIMADENAKLRTQKPAAGEKPAAVDEKDVEAAVRGIPAEDVADFGPRLTGFMVAIARNVMNATAAPLRRSVEEVQRASEYEIFLDDVERLAPGFKLHNGNVERNTPATPEWNEWLDSDRDGFGTWREFLTGKPVEKIALAFRDFFLPWLTSKKPGAKTPVPDAAAQVAAPTVAAASAPANAAGEKPVLRYADYEALKKRAEDGAGSMTIVEWNKLREELSVFQLAALEGRLR